MPTLEFEGKSFVYSHHLSVPYRELLPVKEKGIGEPELSGNLLIYGDNLEALKALLPLYAGRVDVIYIDPPYNTGNEGWAYNDNVNSPVMKEWLGAVVGTDDLQRHDKWLSMMWPRLQLMDELLSEAGIIMVSCDDEECHRLRQIMDEIFGDNRFIAQLVWKSRTSEDTRAKSRVSTDHEYILCYSASADGSLRGVEKDESKFSNPDGDNRGPWRSADLTGLATKDRRPNLHYDLIDPATGINYGCPPKGWRYEKPTMDAKIAERRVLWPTDPEGRPRHKLFSEEIKRKFKNISSVIGNIGTEHGTREANAILGDGVFDFPKPSRLVADLIHQAGDSEALILDAFAGSGTTGHAVLQLNNDDGGNRKFVLVQLPEQTKAGSAAALAGYSEVVDVTAERLRRVAAGVPASKDKTLKAGLGGSFTYCELGQLMEADRYFDAAAAPSWEQVARYVIYTATGETISVPSSPREDWLIGEVGGQNVHVIYRSDLSFMRSPEAALTLELARRIADTARRSSKTALVFGAAPYVSARELHRLGITFVQLPWSVHQRLNAETQS